MKDNPNPYRPPGAQFARENSPAISSKRWVVVSWGCSFAVVAYALVAAIANGIDLARTLSSRDAKTEVRLLLLFGFGCFLCWLTYSVRKRQRTDHTFLTLVMALSGVAYVLYDLL